MATFTTTYAGKDARGLLTEALANVASFAQDGFVIDEEAVGKAVFRLVDIASAAWVDDDGEFVDQNNLQIADKTVPLVFKKVNETLKKKDIKLDWMGLKAQKGATGTISAEDQAKIREAIVSMVAKATDAYVWNKIITAAAADADVHDVALVSTNFTVDGIIGELNKVAGKYSELTNNYGSARVYMNPKDVMTYNNALGMQSNTLDSTKWHANSYNGIPIVSTTAIPAGSVFMTPKENLGFACDLFSDLSEVRFLDQSDVTGANKIHIVANMALEGAYVRGSELVYGLGA